MRFGIVSDCYGLNIPLLDAVKRLVQIGFKDLEITPGHLYADPGNLPTATKDEKRLTEIQRYVVALGMKICQVHGPYGANDLVARTEKERQTNIDVYKRWVDCCRCLGTGTLIVHIGGRNDLSASRNPAFIREKNIDSLAQLVAHIGKDDLRLAIENLTERPNRFVPEAFNIYGNRIPELIEIIETIGTDRIGICLDTGHANLEKLDLPLTIRESGKHLIATHIHENDGRSDLHMFPFSLRRQFSNMDWSSIFKAFQDTKYPYPLIGECANTTGEFLLELEDFYLKNQKRLIEMFIAGLPD